MDISSLEKMLDGPRDNAMLRLTLGRLLIEADRPAEAVDHLSKAVAMDAAYTAAWKELGRANAQAGQPDAAKSAWIRGLEVADQQGDKQAGKEMQVFLRRLERAANSSQ